MFYGKMGVEFICVYFYVTFPVLRRPWILILLFLFYRDYSNLVFAEELLFNAAPYRIKFCLAPDFPVSDSEKNLLYETLTQRSKNQVGELWELAIEFSAESSAAQAVALFESQYRNPPPEWNQFDKVFLAVLRQNPAELQVQEFDVTTRWAGRRQTYTIDYPVKTADVLWQALTENFSPLAKLETASPSSATLRIKGSEIFIPSGSAAHLSNFVTKTVLQRGVLLSFVAFRNPDGKTGGVSPVPHTVLLAEEYEQSSDLLRCTVRSSLPGSLMVRRRGLTEIFALALPTPKTPTLLQIQPPRQDGAEEKSKEPMPQTLPIYDVLEIVPGGSELKRVGQTHTDGSFLLEAHETYQVRTIILRSGRSVLAKFPVVRGLEEKMFVSIPDDSVRLEAESVLLGLQEEIIDTVARRRLLAQKLAKVQETGDDKQIRETRTELAKLKDAARFMVELDQFQLRFHSVEPLVQRRINRLFNDTRKAVQSAALH